MSKYFVALFLTALTMQAAPISGLPTISVTAATGQAFWGNREVLANLSGASFTLNLSAPYPQEIGDLFFFDLTPGDTFGPGGQGNDSQWMLSSDFALFTYTPTGTVVVNGASMPVGYEDGLAVQVLGEHYRAIGRGDGILTRLAYGRRAGVYAGHLRRL